MLVDEFLEIKINKLKYLFKLLFSAHFINRIFLFKVDVIRKKEQAFFITKILSK